MNVAHFPSAAFLACLLFATPGLCTTMTLKDLVCPACGHRFSAVIIHSTNTVAHDSDSCPRANGAQPLLAQL